MARIAAPIMPDDEASARVTIGEPAPDLAADVVRFHAYSERIGAPLRRRELPSGQATLVFNLGDDLDVAFPGDAPETFHAGGAFFSGLGTRYAVTEARCAQEGAQVMLSALGARRLLGMPLEEVGDRLIDPCDLFGAAARDLRDRLQEANSHARRLAILAEAMRDRARRAAPLPGDLTWALDRLRRSRGRRSVESLADEVGCSRRHLSRRFAQEFGMPPKRLARLLRFNAAVEALKADRVESWATLAADCGYADQAHLSRDFAEFAGDPPAAFARRRLNEEGGFRD